MATVVIKLSLDDSGKLNSNEKFTVYAGLAFYTNDGRDEFIRKYKSSVHDIRCLYCRQNEDSCNKKCSELKSNGNISNEHRRQLLNHIKHEYTYAIVIDNSKIIRKEILNDKRCRGRYIDFAHKRIIKAIFMDFISKKIINPQDDINLYLFYDEQPTVTNGYYDLESSIKEELLYGIHNFNYNCYFQPILTGTLNVTLRYYDSRNHYDIQAADMLAGTIRHIMINEQFSYEDRISKIDKLTSIKLMLP